MTPLQIASIILVLAAASGCVNYFFLRLPSSIGIMVIALVGSMIVLGIDHLHPGLHLAEQTRDLVSAMELSGSLLDGMLGLLLFAGALHVSLSDLRREALAVFLMATLGVALSTVIVGLGFSWVTGMPLLIALVFGALISPTDPVAVLGILREAKIRNSLEIKIAGESLFNDGVGYVVFLLLIGLAFPAADAHGAGAFDLASAVTLFLREAVGGGVLGLALGWGVFRLMRRIDDYALEVMLTLALALGGYELALALGVSAPIMAVVAGLMIGNVGRRDAMSDETRRYVDGFWQLIDEILNAALFLMIGMEIFQLDVTRTTLLFMGAAIGLALAARLASVALPILLLYPIRREGRDVVPLMTWGGLKGGISVALALSLPASDWKDPILAATYAVVVFSILVQGLTLGPLARRLMRDRAHSPGP
ncbi:cation:proton antiporter [Falsirhodobacter halotolerans]|uniref:cation:proton antiporter n=1 Tax=Falsirhodobacter halotolerans TaxID=1146892 RepID=UPI001FD3A24C|nr:sodium:proton antiporter [Falsirhodobacter halotolerans]MCJ8140022.1 sodium:proton antiporter [Falsirhodobacter halotolerans]